MQPTRSVRPFEVVSEYTPSGDQPAGDRRARRTASTPARPTSCCSARPEPASRATTAWLIEQVQRPTLVLAHNKTLAAQLANEFRELMPNNAVEYFVSYYDYYQPEAYVPQTDTFIEKDSSINAEVERLRHSTTNSLLSRRDVIVVSTVSCIYGLGARRGVPGGDGRPAGGRCASPATRSSAASSTMQYERNDVDFSRGKLPGARRHDRDHPGLRGARDPHRDVRRRDRGDLLAAPAHRRRHRARSTPCRCFPATHYVASPEAMHRAIGTIKDELARAPGRAREAGQAARGAAAAHAHHLRPRDDGADRLLQRHRELLAAHRRPAARRGAALPARLLPRRLPRRHRRVARDRAADRRDVRGRRVAASARSSSTASACRARSTTGRCRWEEFLDRVGQKVYLSATPGTYELRHGATASSSRSSARPASSTRRSSSSPSKGQIDDLLEEIRLRAERRRARARHDADQEDGGGAHRLPRRGRACGCATCTRTSTPCVAWSC